jgi:hypothetical protein
MRGVSNQKGTSKLMYKIFKILLISSLAFTGTCSAGEWYEGGTLTDQNAIVGQDASLANKIAPSADFVAVMFQGSYLKLSISSLLFQAFYFKQH